MHVAANLDPRLALRDVAAHARRVEAMGYDALHVPETVHDSLAVSLLALEHTTSLVVRTSVTVAFPRSPMLSAYAAWDLARFSGGRFQLGLGTQVRANIEERYSVPWAEPVARMRDYVAALRAIFHSFRTGGALDHDGEHYRFTRLQPYFNPGPDDGPAPPIWLGGVNEGICALAGEVADGFVTHPTSANPRYLDSVCRPALEEGAARAGRSIDDLELVVGGLVVTGPTRAALVAERERHRATLAFLYSTPAYWRTLELHGWPDLGPRLHELTRADRWSDLAALVTDDVLDALVPQATYGALPAAVAEWFGGRATGVLLAPPQDPADDGQLAAAIRGIQGR